MSNILLALNRITENYKEDVSKSVSGENNRMNAMGERLETYIKDIFANTLNVDDKIEKNEKINRVFSYTGNKTNPPDMMLRNGDAIEVKKIESPRKKLQLNSSYPKSKLKVTNPKINEACRTCETWEEKDLIYCIGYVKNKQLLSLWFVYGDCFAAEEETYTKVENIVKDNLNDINYLTINEETNELSGIQNIDPLDITYLRIRGMWIIENPSKVYEHLYEMDYTARFQFATIMKTEKYLSFADDDRHTIEENPSIDILDVKIQNPNNPADLLDAKLITYRVES